jgi:hypothetical protein
MTDIINAKSSGSELPVPTAEALPPITGTSVQRKSDRIHHVRQEEQPASGHRGVDPQSYLGMDTEIAVATAKSAGIELIRVLQFVNGGLVGPMDMMFAVNRLTLGSEEGKVASASWG